MGVGDVSPDPHDAVGPGSGNYIRESELTRVTLESVIRGGYGGMDVTKDEFIHTRTSPLGFRVLVKILAARMDTSRKAIIRHGIRQGLALLLARVTGAKDCVALYDTAVRLAVEEGSNTSITILETGHSYNFLYGMQKQYQLPCYPEYRDIMADRSEALGIPSTRLAYICIFLSCMTVNVPRGLRKSIQQEILNFSESVDYRYRSLKNLSKYD